MASRNLTSYQELALFLGESNKVVSAWKSRNSSSAVKKIMEVCGKDSDLEWIISGAATIHSDNTSPAPALTRRIPVISWVQAGGWGEAVDNFHPGDADEWILVDASTGPRSFSLRVVGDSMDPEFHDGELIVVDPDQEARNGDFVVAQINGHESTFKRLAIDCGRTYLKPLNREYQTLDVTGETSLRIVGRVMEKRKRY